MIRRLLRPQRGQALIEYAIALNVFLLLTICVVDLGRAVWTYNTVAFLARDGARYGIVSSRGPSEITKWVTDDPKNAHACNQVLGNPCPASVTVVPGTCSSTPAPVVVTVDAPFTPVLASFWGGGPLSLSATSQMYLGGCAA